AIRKTDWIYKDEHKHYSVDIFGCCISVITAKIPTRIARNSGGLAAFGRIGIYIFMFLAQQASPEG
ncbi:MAG: hypothetical protein FWD57_08710, partial [Polyangiaceae bacterium]|nr:hypothetical protein [Polyangiaceae bacterium]